MHLFEFQNLDGATAPNISVTYGITNIVTYNCKNVTVLDRIVKCDLFAGNGGNLIFQVQLF